MYLRGSQAWKAAMVFFFSFFLSKIKVALWTSKEAGWGITLSFTWLIRTTEKPHISCLLTECKPRASPFSQLRESHCRSVCVAVRKASLAWGDEINLLSRAGGLWRSVKEWFDLADKPAKIGHRNIHDKCNMHVSTWKRMNHRTNSISNVSWIKIRCCSKKIYSPVQARIISSKFSGSTRTGFCFSHHNGHSSLTTYKNLTRNFAHLRHKFPSHLSRSQNFSTWNIYMGANTVSFLLKDICKHVVKIFPLG